MKTIVGIMMVMALAAGATAQESNSVYSVNAVGYVKRVIEPGEFDFVASPFEQIDGSTPTVSQLLPDIPNNTTVFLWNQSTQQYDVAFKNFLGGWDNDLSIPRGTGFFILIDDGETDPVDLTFLGEVPGATTYPTATKALADGPGFTAVGSPYPVSKTVSTSGFNELPNNTTLFLWNAETQQYDVVFKNFLGTWDFPDMVIEPGQAVFVQMDNNESADFVEDVPYIWPDN